MCIHVFCSLYGDSPIKRAAAQALDVALKHNTSMNPKCQAFARAFFWADPDKIRPLGGGAEVRCIFRY